MDEELSQPIESSDEPVIEGSRINQAIQLLEQYPIDKYLDWYKVNHPEIYAGYQHAKSKVVVEPVQKISSTKSILIVLGILIVFVVAVIWILFGFLGQANEFLNFA